MPFHKKLTLLACALALLIIGGAAGAATKVDAKTAAKEPLITASFKDTPLEAALKLTFRNLPNVFVVAPEVASHRVTLKLKKTPLSKAVDLVTKAAGVTYVRQQHAWLFMAPVPSSEADTGPMISLSLIDSPVDSALRIVFRDTSYSFVLDPGACKDTRITLQLEAPFSQAVRAISAAAGLMHRREGDVWYFYAPTPTVTLNGKQVPIIGAMQVGPNGYIAAQVPEAPPKGTAAPHPLTTPGHDDLVARIGPIMRGTSGQPGGPSVSVPVFPGLTDPLVRLEVDNAPIREAVAKLTAACAADIVVYPEVPENLRVTAHVYMVPLTQFLSDLANQSHLSVSSDALGAEGKQKARYYLIPYSSLKITNQPGGVLFDKSEMPAAGYCGADLTVVDTPYAEAVAKFAAASGRDIVVDPAVPSTLRVTAHVYRLSPDALLDLLVNGAGLEMREALVTAEGAVCVPAPNRGRPANSHDRYYIVPKSELKISGLPPVEFPRFRFPPLGPCQRLEFGLPSPSEKCWERDRAHAKRAGAPPLGKALRRFI